MIHNTFLIRVSTLKILANSSYWPVKVNQKDIKEFVTTSTELRAADVSLRDLPLIVGDNKFGGKEIVKDLLLVFACDRNEDDHSLQDRLTQASKILKKRIAEVGLDSVITDYARLIEESVTTRLKIALVGEGGVGKTTALHLLLGDTPPLQYVPTIALNLETVENIRFGNYSLVIWDFAGQERFRTLWRFYFHGADVIFLVCDSTLRNVIISKDILKLIRRDAPKVPVFAIANKQDKPNAMKPEVVQKVLGVPTYPMVAIDKAKRDEMLRILMTAAAQYVGVALPDVPAKDLLRFTDEATERASKVTVRGEKQTKATDEGVVEVVEEVLVDEAGHVVEADGEYEIVEEVEEIVDTVEEETPSVPTARMEPAAHTVEEQGTVAEEQGTVTEEQGTVAEEQGTVAEEQGTHPPSDDVELTAATESQVRISTELGDAQIEISDSEIEISDSEIEIEVSEEGNGVQLAKEFLCRELEADEILVEELDAVPATEIDKALEALRSDEAAGPDDGTLSPQAVGDDEKKGLVLVLGRDSLPKSNQDVKGGTKHTVESGTDVE
ncbi:MAG: GTP-binding protein [Candidatus Thorarchaeota archaeon]|nr:GTP-binding protein [Candidatus Thorarchaeota archaeon]